MMTSTMRAGSAVAGSSVLASRKSFLVGLPSLPVRGCSAHLVLRQRHACHEKRQRLAVSPQAVATISPPPPPPSAAPQEEEGVPVSELKAQLLDSLFGTERGLAASSEVRAEINELITQLEAQNPNPSLLEDERVLDGQWKLVYTSNSELSGVLALARLPFVAVGDYTQKIENGVVENKVQLNGPFSSTSISTTASIQVLSPKRVQLRFERGTVATPELKRDVELPSSISLLGQPVDLSSLKEALLPAQSAAQDAMQRLAQIVSQQPDLQFPISSDNQLWYIITYVDEDMRVTRGDGGSVFVQVKEYSSSIPTDPSTTAIVGPIDPTPPPVVAVAPPVAVAPAAAPAPYLSEVTTDPLEDYCKGEPDADECRVYEA